MARNPVVILSLAKPQPVLKTPVLERGPWLVWLLLLLFVPLADGKAYVEPAQGSVLLSSSKAATLHEVHPVAPSKDDLPTQYHETAFKPCSRFKPMTESLSATSPLLADEITPVHAHLRELPASTWVRFVAALYLDSFRLRRSGLTLAPPVA